MAGLTSPIVIRYEKEEKYNINTAMPIEGRPIVSVQGKDITTTTISFAGRIPESENCSSLAIYGEEFSGKVSSNRSQLKYAGTPYETTVVTCLGD